MIVNPFIEFKPNRLDKKEWLIIDYYSKRKLYVKESIIKNIIKFSKSKEINYEKNNEKLINNLMNLGLIIDEEDEDIKYFLDLKSMWEKYNWDEAFKYHISSIDYEFEGNRDRSIMKMKSYSEAERDDYRTKEYSFDTSFDLMTKQEIISAFKKKQTDNLDFYDKLIMIISISFCYFKKGIPGWKGNSVYYRTSPSGGARQASEGYIYIRDNGKINPGWYYINSITNRIERINTNMVNSDEIKRVFNIATINTDIEVSAIIVITSNFEKNMYRYREARTFRTIHMEAGHICGLIEALCNEYEIQNFIQYGVPENKVEDWIKINLFEEGYQSAIILGELVREENE